MAPALNGFKNVCSCLSNRGSSAAACCWLRPLQPPPLVLCRKVWRWPLGWKQHAPAGTSCFCSLFCKLLVASFLFQMFSNWIRHVVQLTIETNFFKPSQWWWNQGSNELHSVTKIALNSWYLRWTLVVFYGFSHHSDRIRNKSLKTTMDGVSLQQHSFDCPGSSKAPWGALSSSLYLVVTCPPRTTRH